SIIGITLAFVDCSLWVRADRTRPQNGARRVSLGRQQARRRLAILYPFLKRSQGIEAAVRDSGTLQNSAVVHAGNHEEAQKILRSFSTSDVLLNRFVILDRPERWHYRIRPSVPHQQLAAASSEGLQIRLIRIVVLRHVLPARRVPVKVEIIQGVLFAKILRKRKIAQALGTIDSRRVIAYISRLSRYP